jgi:hypothetical protein
MLKTFNHTIYKIVHPPFHSSIPHPQPERPNIATNYLSSRPKHLAKSRELNKSHQFMDINTILVSLSPFPLQPCTTIPTAGLLIL